MSAEHDEHAVGDGSRDEQRRDCDQAERPVVDRQVDHHEQEAERTGDQAGVELVLPESRGDLLHRADLESHGERAVLQHVGKCLGLVGCERPADDRAATQDRLADVRRGLNEAVEHDAELVLR